MGGVPRSRTIDGGLRNHVRASADYTDRCRDLLGCEPAPLSPLPRVPGRLKTGDPIRIVAIGSSSTVGLWVMSPAATYPEVMRRGLSELWPTARIEIINSGRIGDTIAAP